LDLDYSTGERAFRDEVRAWLGANLPAALRDKVVRYDHLTRDDHLGWHRILADKGWIAPAWPVEWGGTGWNVVQRYIFDEECGYAGAPPVVPFGLTMCAAVLLKFGTDAQKQRFLPRIYRGDDFWCQGYSEPNSGSDLGLAQGRRRCARGDRYIVNGQKIWTTLAHMADWIFCLVRTDPSPERKQEGHLVPADRHAHARASRAPAHPHGRRPRSERSVLRRRRGAGRQPRARREQGWTVAKYLLGHERLNTARIGTSKRELEHLKSFAASQTKDGRPADRRHAVSRQALAPDDRADGARDHEPPLPRPAARRARAGRGGFMLKIKAPRSSRC
jgi:alkylation response protein AidB-like acyl-CoA dehydrogenase